MAQTVSRKYTFLVDPKVTKSQIQKVVKERYQVDPIGVNILKVLSKSVRTGRTLGRTKSFKKVVVTVKKDQKITDFEIKEEKTKEKTKK